jgi:hypothetical protein
MSALEHDVEELRELVDGQEPWSHRKRLHALDADKRGAELVAQALTDFRELRTARSTRIREWGAFALALAAIALSASGPF